MKYSACFAASCHEPRATSALVISAGPSSLGGLAMAKQKFKPANVKKSTKREIGRAAERKTQLTPTEVATREALWQHRYFLHVQTGLLVLLTLLVFAAGVEGALLFGNVRALRSAEGLRVALPVLALLLGLEGTPVAMLVAMMLLCNTVLALARTCCYLCGGDSGRGLCAVAFAFLHLMRLLLLLESELPRATRGMWRLLRGVDDEPLKRVSVRRFRAPPFLGRGVAHDSRPSRISTHRTPQDAPLTPACTPVCRARRTKHWWMHTPRRVPLARTTA